jgi:hypothetical protein
MSCCNSENIFDLGIFKTCGVQELPILLPSGDWILRVNWFDSFKDFEFSGAIKLSLDFGILPIQTEMTFSIINKTSGDILPFDIEVNQGTECDPDLITKCFQIFKFKSVYEF